MKEWMFWVLLGWLASIRREQETGWGRWYFLAFMIFFLIMAVVKYEQ